MSIRAYLILSYLALVFLLLVSVYGLVEWSLNRLITHNLSLAEDAIINTSMANYEKYKKAIANQAENIIEIKAEEVSDQLSYVLKGQTSRDYVDLRNDEFIKGIATQDIYIDDVVVGYINVYDNKG